MTKPTLSGKSLMLVPVCDGDQIAAAILDYLYLYFQIPSPYQLFFEVLQQEKKEVIPDDFYQYDIQKEYAPFNLSREGFPESWLFISMAELRNALTWNSNPLDEDIIEGLKILQNKDYLSIEDWGLFDENPKNYLYTDYLGKPSRAITCWLHLDRVDYAVEKYYSDHLALPPIDDRIDVKREKRIVSSQVHRAKRLGQAASLTFHEWTQTLAFFKMRCAFCQRNPYEVLEHFIPVIHGGSTSVFNCIPACEICNALKSDRLPHEIVSNMGEERIRFIELYLEERRKEWVKKKTEQG